MFASIKNIISEIVGQEVVLELPKNRDFGHIATPIAFSLAKIKKLPPTQIAQEICAKLESKAEFSKVSQVNGYINLTLSAEFFHHCIQSAFENTLTQKKSQQEKILLEYVSANPTGPLHIGHARGAVYGDSLKRVGEYLGKNITTEYYIDDAGAQMDKLAYSLALSGLRILEASPLPQILLEAEEAGETYKGEYIAKSAQDAISHFGKDFF